MDNIKDDNYYVGKILKDLRFIMSNTQDLTPEDLEKNEILCDSILFRLIQVSENSLKLSTEFKEKHNQVSWRAMKGMRNRIVHGYDTINFEIVWNTAMDSIPELMDYCNHIIIYNSKENS